MSTHFIVSVGTSVISNHAENFDKSTYRDSRTDGIPHPSEFCDRYDRIKKELAKPECQSAEEKSILKVIEHLNLNLEDCHFHFIATNTKECKFCAAYLGHEVFKNGESSFYLPASLGEATDDAFVKRGVPELLSVVAKILDEVEQKKHHAVIVPTGGYKAIIPYLTIAGILFKQPIYYIYEDSEKLLELPAPPLGVNTTEFRSALVLLENSVDSDMASAEPFLKELPENFRNLVYEKEGLCQYTAFGGRLKEMFLMQPVSPLATRVTGNQLIPRLGAYENEFRAMTSLGTTVWIGDKAPEMADHARHHHLNLLAYTELLLSPILDHDPDFLSQEELFLLLGTVYLHDCGHSACMLPVKDGLNVPLLPTEIRNYHNLLGYLRMTDDRFKALLKRQGLSLSSETIQTIALLSLFHRKKMPLLRGGCTSPENKEFKPLKDYDIRYADKAVRGELILALFRIIDGMDKQIGRAGDATEISMKAESILADLAYLKTRIERLEGALNTLPEEDCQPVKETVDEVLSDIFKKYAKQEKVTSATQSSNVCKGLHAMPHCGIKCGSIPAFTEDTPRYEQLKKQLAEHGRERYLHLAWEYLEARVRFMFQALQPSYYYSDVLLAMPRVTHTIENSRRHITINYKLNDNPDAQNKIKNVWDEIKKWIMDKNNNIGYPENTVLSAKLPEPQKLAEGIREEYCRAEKENLWVSEVAQILHDNGVAIEFQFEGAPVSCWQNDS